ncbi:MAG: DNA polymerase III subunit chi [Bdellovibrionales bacterium]
MTEVRFYHLTKKSLEQTLPDLLERVLDLGKKAVIKIADENAIPDMSKHLWVCRRNGFYPHGTDGEGHPDHDPLWLTTKDDNPINADTLILTMGAEAESIDQYKIVCIMLNGHNDNEVKSARERWKIYKEQGLELTYWQQSEKGNWEKKA